MKIENLNEHCKLFHEKMSDIDLKELPLKIKEFALILQQELEFRKRKRELKTAPNFLDYIF